MENCFISYDYMPGDNSFIFDMLWKDNPSILAIRVCALHQMVDLTFPFPGS